MEASARAEDSTFDTEAALTSLHGDYPLPIGMTRPELFDEVVQVEGLSIHSIGLCASHPAGRTLTGAAAELESYPLERAYFELFERAALIHASESGKSFVARDVTQRSHGILNKNDVFPSSNGAVQRHALSSGVAVQRDWPSACRAAAAELVERDHVLRCWYGQTRAERISLLPDADGLREIYDLYAYRFPSSAPAPAKLSVAGVFGFPRAASAPLVMGFAARATEHDAIAAAFRESLQQLAFGWGEPVPDAPPEVSAEPEFHLDFYNYAGHQHALRAWLDGAHYGMGPKLPKLRDEFLFVDLTPEATTNACVVKALNATAVPLCFGLGHPWFEGLPEPMLVHPIA